MKRPAAAYSAEVATSVTKAGSCRAGYHKFTGKPGEGRPLTSYETRLPNPLLNDSILQCCIITYSWLP